MIVLDVASRADRHKDLLDAAEAFGESALIYFERGGQDGILNGNRMALNITPSSQGDIGWQIVDVALMLTRHKDALKPDVTRHLNHLLFSALSAWSDREFGRGNVNHPVIATWLFAAAGKAFSKPEYSRIADERLRRFLHIFSQAGDMSEYNSPTYLGPTLVGLACIGEYAEYHSTRLRARLVEERIWLSTMARWHSPSQQLAGPHSRAYADSTLGFGGIVRYLAHAVLSSPVFWDNDLAKTYDHNYEAEWAARIAACKFCFPDYLQLIGEQKRYPYKVFSSTDGEDYTVDGKEIYRGGWGKLFTNMTGEYCLGSSERPYVDGGQTEMCIAYWKRRDPVRQFTDLRALYFRYIANNRLPLQVNKYYSWYGGAERIYSPNLLHQDGRQHVFQHDSKAIILSQPSKRENGMIISLRFDMLLPVYEPLDEIWLGDQQIHQLPIEMGWQVPVLIRDGSVYLAIHPLKPTNIDGAIPALELAEINHHLILSIYNLRGTEARSFPTHVFEQTHNGLVLELGAASEFGDFEAFRRHIALTTLTEQWLLEEIRQVDYHSGTDKMRYVYHTATQETIASEINGIPVRMHEFTCPDAVQSSSGKLAIGNVSLMTDADIPAWLVYKEGSGSISAVLPADQPGAMRLETPVGVVECASFSTGRICIEFGDIVKVDLDSIDLQAPVFFSGFERIDQVLFSGRIMQLKETSTAKVWELS